MIPTSQEYEFVRQRLASCRPGYSLPQDFYVNETIYRVDLQRIWRRGWLFIGFSCQLPNRGDFITFQLGNDSIIVVRQDQNDCAAFHNLCRHRGALICDHAQGNVKKFVCPYHQWTYDLSGELLSCRGMQSDIDKNDLGLKKVSVQEFCGMLFVCVSDHPPEFEPATQCIGPLAKPQGFQRAKVAHVINYEVRANWKVVWENNRECYHCNVNHPEYIKANFDIYDDQKIPNGALQQLKSQLQKSQSLELPAGIAVTHKTAGIATFPDAENNLWYSANRTVLAEGYVTESLDGNQVAPLMGDYVTAEVGTLRIRTMPNMWNHSSCDHAVTSRLLPLGPERTEVRVYWLVDEDAIEGKDYVLSDLLPFWQATSEQDWELCERVQRGVRSSQYRPGPLSSIKEYNVEAFLRWYLQQLPEKQGLLENHLEDTDDHDVVSQ